MVMWDIFFVVRQLCLVSHFWQGESFLVIRDIFDYMRHFWLCETFLLGETFLIRWDFLLKWDIFGFVRHFWYFETFLVFWDIFADFQPLYLIFLLIRKIQWIWNPWPANSAKNFPNTPDPFLSVWSVNWN